MSKSLGNCILYWLYFLSIVQGVHFDGDTHTDLLVMQCVPCGHVGRGIQAFPEVTTIASFKIALAGGWRSSFAFRIEFWWFGGLTFTSDRRWYKISLLPRTSLLLSPLSPSPARRYCPSSHILLLNTAWFLLHGIHPDGCYQVQPPKTASEPNHSNALEGSI